MNSTKLTISDATPVPTTVRGDSAAGVSRARQAARAFTDRLVPTPCLNVADAVVLVVSELVTNALRHGDGTFTLRLHAHPDAVEVAVDDPSPRWPRMRNPDLTGSGGGFGWPMVNRLARTTAVTHRAAGGKTVMAFLSR
ncbi:ATP-binding protein [Streptomyces sp. DH18]|uniref:ATP-binding protein n=1 Tax=unclassified Streptomyces TaxID=2593676 RepID=UPI001E42BDB1|nr:MULTISPECIES: ATP-binding protein [unclassified Streptomyces]MDG9684648.1 ATP-binding protein [Streptomyces sp. DH18]